MPGHQMLITAQDMLQAVPPQAFDVEMSTVDCQLSQIQSRIDIIVYVHHIRRDMD